MSTYILWYPEQEELVGRGRQAAAGAADRLKAVANWHCGVS